MSAPKYINITHLKDCSGCGACASICPKHCICMNPDKLGCLYPKVDTSLCIECGACLRVCPFLNPAQPLETQQCFAAVNNKDNERMCSSSGGVFIALARNIISHGGVVFGAVFDDNWSVHHVAAESIEEVKPMMGSKYLQSSTGETYAQTREYLKEGREVLYTGTPCQIAGLKHFLKKDHPNLLAVEVICHGAPAPAVWQSYLKETINRPQGDEKIRFRDLSNIKEDMPVIAGINFRDKRNGWKKYGFALTLAGACGGEKNTVSPLISQSFNENDYMKAFLRNWSLRPSCYACRAKSGRSHADLTIGDFWGVEHYTSLPDDDRGTSCVIVRSGRGQKAIELAKKINLSRTDYEIIFRGNPSLEKCVKLTVEARYFHWLLPRKGFYDAFIRVTQQPLWLKILKLPRRIYNKIRRTFRR